MWRGVAITSWKLTPLIKSWILDVMTTRKQLRRLKRIVFLVSVPYIMLVLMFAFFQRSLIYFPTRESRIEPSHAGLPTGQVHDICVETKDGVELHGWHVLPDGRTATDLAEYNAELASGRPVVLFFSGNAANRRYRVGEFQILTSLGCDVLIFDYRGYGENDGSPSEEGLANDVRAAWDYATQQRKIEPERIILY